MSIIYVVEALGHSGSLGKMSMKGGKKSLVSSVNCQGKNSDINAL